MKGLDDTGGQDGIHHSSSIHHPDGGKSGIFEDGSNLTGWISSRPACKLMQSIDQKIAKASLRRLKQIRKADYQVDHKFR